MATAIHIPVGNLPELRQRAMLRGRASSQKERRMATKSKGKIRRAKTLSPA
jgi:hypothetical protein